MEQAQKDHIKSNLSELVKVTVCSEALLRILRDRGILGKTDVTQLSTIKQQTSQVMQLYEIMQTRRGGYFGLQNALQETRQEQAYQMLSEIPASKRNGMRSQKYKCGPPQLTTFLRSSSHKALILSSPDFSVTLGKLEDTSTLPVNVFEGSAITIQGSPVKKGHLNVVISRNHLNILIKKVDFIKEKLVVLTSESSQTVKETASQVGIQNLLAVEVDFVKWTDLTVSFQREILKTRKVRVQSREVLLEHVVQLLDLQEQDEAQLGEIFEPGFVLAMVNPESRCLLVRDTLSPRVPFYIPRRLASRSYINADKIFTLESQDIFTFTGIDVEKLGGYGRVYDKVVPNQKFILLEKADEFESICRSTHHPVHLLHYEIGQFIWVKSSGSLELIQLAVSTIQEEFEEVEFIEELHSFQSPVIISAAPGLGKSILLSDVGRHILGKQSDIVVFMRLTELVTSMGKGPPTPGKIVESMVSSTCDTSLGKRYLAEGISRGELKVHLMLDGYDELPPGQMEFANKCLVLIVTAFKSVRLYVTTRLHLLHGLESTLQVLGYNLQPFSYSDQLHFLTLYWTRNMSDEEKQNTSRMELFAEQSLKVLKENFCCENDTENLTVVPLHCLMFAEIYNNEAVYYFEKVDDINYPLELTLHQIPDMYEGLVEMKMQLASSSTFSVNELMYSHAYLAVQILFPEWCSKLRTPIANQNITQDALLKVGLLQVKGGLLGFTHHTFAYYFVAWLVVQLLSESKCSKETADFLCKVVLEVEQARVCAAGYLSGKVGLTAYSFKHEMLLHFLNHLTRNANFGTKVTLYVKSNHVSSHKLMSFAIACVYHDLDYIFAHFYKFHERESLLNILDEPLLHVAVLRRSHRVLESFLRDFPTLTGKKLQEVQLEYGSVKHRKTCSLLHVSVCQGDWKSTMELLDKHGFRKLFHHPRDFPHHLLHFTVQSTYTCNNLTEIQKKIQIIRLLLGENGTLLEERNEKGYTPLLSPSVHANLLTELIDMGADVNVLTGDGENVLHLAAKYLSPEQYHCLATAIPSESLSSLLKMKDKSHNRTVLHRIVMYFDLLQETLELLANAGTDFNSVDKNGKTGLLVGIEHGRSVSFLQALITQGADWTLTNKRKRSALHMAAYKGHLEAVNFFTAFSVDLNGPDASGNTPLHYALLNKRERERFEIVKYLIERQANVNARNGNDFTPLWHAFKVKPQHLDLKTIELLLVAGAVCTSEIATLAIKLLILDGSQLGSSSNSDNEPSERLKFIHVVLDLGAVLSPRDARGKTLLHAAVQRGWLDVVQLLVSKGMSVDDNDTEMNTPLHYAFFERDHLQMVRFLVDQQKANVRRRNLQGHSAIEYAESLGLQVDSEAAVCVLESRRKLREKDAAEAEESAKIKATMLGERKRVGGPYDSNYSTFTRNTRARGSSGKDMNFSLKRGFAERKGEQNRSKFYKSRANFNFRRPMRGGKILGRDDLRLKINGKIKE